MSKKPAKLQQQELQLLSDAMSGITPLRQDRIILSPDKKPVFVPRTNYDDKDQIVDKLSDQYDPFENEQQRNDLNYHHHSISKKQFLALKKERFNAELILDLHGVNRQQARIELIEFIAYSQQHDYRRIIIMPGQGEGILRQALNSWLRQLPEVLAFAESPQRTGGKGVIRILIAANHRSGHFL